MAALQHDHIVSVFQVGEDNGVLYLAMPLLHGLTLRDRLKLSPPLTMAEILRIGRETAEGLAAARPRADPSGREAGEYLARGGSGRVKILDFGLARVANEDTQLTQYGTVVGLPPSCARAGSRPGRLRLSRRPVQPGWSPLPDGHGQTPVPGRPYHRHAAITTLGRSHPSPQPQPRDPRGTGRLDPSSSRQGPRRAASIRRVGGRGDPALEQAESSPSWSSLELTVKWKVTAQRVWAVRNGPRSSAGSGRAGGRIGLPGARSRRGTRPAALAPEGSPDRAVVLVPPRITPPGPARRPLGTPAQGQGPTRKVAIRTWPTPPPAHPRLPGLIPAPIPRRTGRWQVETRSPRDAVLSLAWSPDRQRLACAAGEKVVRSTRPKA